MGLGCTLFLSRVPHKDEFYLGRFLMRQPLHYSPHYIHFVNFFVFYECLVLLCAVSDYVLLYVLL